MCSMSPIDHMKVKASTPEGQELIGWAKSKARFLSELMSGMGIDSYQKTLDLGEGHVVHIRKAPVGQDNIHNINVYTVEEAVELGLLAHERKEILISPTVLKGVLGEEPEIKTNPTTPTEVGPTGAEIEFYIGLEMVCKDTAQFGEFYNISKNYPVDRWRNGEPDLFTCEALWKCRVRPRPEDWEEGDPDPQIVNPITDPPDMIVPGLGHRHRSGDRHYEEDGSNHIDWANDAAPKFLHPNGTWGEARLWRVPSAARPAYHSVSYLPDLSHAYADIQTTEWDQTLSTTKNYSKYLCPLGSPRVLISKDHDHYFPISADYNMVEFRNTNSSIDGGDSFRVYSDGRVSSTHSGKTIEHQFDCEVTAYPVWPTQDNGQMVKFEEWYYGRAVIDPYEHPCSYWIDPYDFGMPMTIGGGHPSTTIGNSSEYPFTPGSLEGVWNTFPVKWQDHLGDPDTLAGIYPDDTYFTFVDLSSGTSENWDALGLSNGGHLLPEPFAGEYKPDFSALYAISGKYANMTVIPIVSRNYTYIKMDSESNEFFPRSTVVPQKVAAKTSYAVHVEYNDGEVGHMMLAFQGTRHVFDSTYNAGYAYRQIFEGKDPRDELLPGCAYAFRYFHSPSGASPGYSNADWQQEWFFGTIDETAQEKFQPEYTNLWPYGRYFQDIQTITWGTGVYCVTNNSILPGVTGWISPHAYPNDLSGFRPALYVCLPERTLPPAEEEEGV